MTRRFNHKVFTGKLRVYRPIAGTTGIQRLWVWDAEKNEYTSPEKGKLYEVRRWEKIPTGKKRVTRYFDNLDAAREWQSHVRVGVQQDLGSAAAFNEANAEHLAQARGTGPLFSEIVESYRKRRFPQLARGTCENYEQLLRLHFGMLLQLRVNAITPALIDEWIFSLRTNQEKNRQGRKRKSFDKELDLLSVLLRFYQKYCDDIDFRWPLKARHRDDAKVVRDSGKRDRDLPPEQFARVHSEMRGMFGPLWAAMFTVQWREALRVSEVAALHWEDVHLNFREPELSYIRVCRHVEWSRKKFGVSQITDGFKNSRSMGGVKELPLFPEAFAALKELYFIGAKGLVFKKENGEFFTFRSIQWRYERAFKGAGLPFTGTHTLRHGGCRAIYNETGDVALAGMILGNEDSDTVKVYARRDKKALQKLAHVHWKRAESNAL